MVYLFNIALLIRRYAPTWFRHEVNLQYAYVLASWLERIHSNFLAWRTGTILPEYRYNGLIHSLERCLNDRYDPVERRIYITVVDQTPGYWYLDDGQPAIVAQLEDGQLSGYTYLDDGALPELYQNEFTVNVPSVVPFVASQMFDLLDIYRYAGRRPAIRVFDAGEATLETFYYQTALVANQP